MGVRRGKQICFPPSLSIHSLYLFLFLPPSLRVAFLPAPHACQQHGLPHSTPPPSLPALPYLEVRECQVQKRGLVLGHRLLVQVIPS